MLAQRVFQPSNEGLHTLLPFVDCLERIYDPLEVQRLTLKNISISFQLMLGVFYSFTDASLAMVPVVENPRKINKTWLPAQLKEKREVSKKNVTAKEHYRSGKGMRSH